MSKKKNIYGLCIESSTKNCSIAIFKDAELLCLCEENSDDFLHAEKLHVFIKWALEGAEININELNYVAIGHGPGSYTGLRIGTASAKGLCFALSIPLVSVNSLHHLVNSFKNEKLDYIIPMIDARRMEVYCSIYNANKNSFSITEAKIINLDSFLELQDKKVLFVGSGAEKCKDILKGTKFIYKSEINPSAKDMGEISLKKFNNQELEDIAYFEPLYLKDFITTKPK